MERDVVFVVDKSEGPKWDVAAGRWVPWTEIQVRFAHYGHPQAYMRVTFVDDTMDDKGRQMRLVVHDEQVLLLNPQDILLARVASEAGGQVAVEAAQDLFWQHAVLPSMKTAPHWLSQWAPLWWKRIADIHLRDQEKHCAEVQES